MARIEDLVAGSGIGAGEQHQNIVRPGAADDLVWPAANLFGQGRTEAVAGAVGVAVEFRGTLGIGRHGGLAGAQRTLVRGHLVDRPRARQIMLARYIGGDVHDSGTYGETHDRLLLEGLSAHPMY